MVSFQPLEPPFDTRYDPAPVPAAGVFDSPTVWVCINTHWASHLDGLLERLLYPDAWSGTELEIDSAIQQVGELLIKLAEIQECNGVATTPYILIRDERAAGVGSGDFTAGAWRTRPLNTEVVDTDNLASLASNQITLAAGTYRCLIRATAFYVNLHQARLQNVTDGTTALLGTSESAAATGAYGINTASVIAGRFTIAATKTFEVQHRCNTTRSANGFGTAAGFGNEIYTIAEFWKES